MVHILEKFTQYEFLHGSPLYDYKLFFNHGVRPYTWGLWYITRGFHPSSHTKKIQQTRRTMCFYKVFVYKISQKLEGY